jgi:hypothetical protein
MYPATPRTKPNGQGMPPDRDRSATKSSATQNLFSPIETPSWSEHCVETKREIPTRQRPKSSADGHHHQTSSFLRSYQISPLPCSSRVVQWDQNATTSIQMQSSGAVRDHIEETYQQPVFNRDIHPHDVLFGRGGAANAHHGNRYFRRLVEEHRPTYRNARKIDKPSIANHIVCTIRSQFPPGRFLKRLDEDDRWWIDVGTKKASSKTSQALREVIPSKRSTTAPAIQGKSAITSKCESETATSTPEGHSSVSPLRREKPEHQSHFFSPLSIGL